VERLLPRAIKGLFRKQINMTRSIDVQPISLDDGFKRLAKRIDHSNRMSDRPTGGEAYVFGYRLVIPPGSSYPLSRRETLRLAHPELDEPSI